MPIIGIDLGTSNSLVGYFSEEGPRLIPNALGELLTPSVVSVGEEGEVWVGKVAKERLVTHPECTVDVFKRYMGSTKKVQLGKHVFLPEELSSFVVRALKEDAEHYLGETITEAVISVPAYFNDIQRKATRRAGELAGLKVERIINEPTAAAIAYGMYEEEDDTKFLVFDLGGGTFDVSLLELFDGVMEVRAVAGDNYLGGHDFTDILLRDMLEKNNLKQETLSRKQLAILSKEAERLKVQLSTQDKVSMTYEINEKQTVYYELSLKEYTKMCEPLLTRLRRPIERTISDADVRTNEIDNIVLVGGATKLPIIRDFVSKLFGRLPDFGINPDETIAVGATIQAGMKERHKMIKEVILTDVCPYTLGVGVKGSSFTGELEFSPIIERNMIIPTSRVESYQTIADNQTEVSFKVYQGESIYVKNNILLGEVLCKVPKNKAGMELMDIRFTYDINGLLEVETIVRSTKEKQIKLIKKPEGNISDHELQERLQYLQTLKIHPRDQEEIKLIFARAERLYEESLGQKRDYIASYIRAFEEIVDSQNMLYVKKEAVKLSAKLDELETDRGL